MDTNQEAVKPTGEVETPVSVPPTGEEKTPSEVTSEEPVSAEKPVETPEPQTVVEDGTDDKSESGRAFAEMRHEIKRLKEQVEEKKARQSSFDNIRQFSPSPQYVQVDPNRYVDASGNFNKPAYDADVYKANQHNQQVARQVAADTVEDKLDEYKARQRFPALDTNAKFERVVAAEYQTRLLETLTNPSVPRPSIEKIAEEYAPYFATDQKSVIKETAQKVKQQLTEKEQASLSAAGRSQPSPQTDAEYAELRKKSRYGDTKAIAERMKRLR